MNIIYQDKTIKKTPLQKYHWRELIKLLEKRGIESYFNGEDVIEGRLKLQRIDQTVVLYEGIVSVEDIQSTLIADGITAVYVSSKNAFLETATQKLSSQEIDSIKDKAKYCTNTLDNLIKETQMLGDAKEIKYEKIKDPVDELEVILRNSISTIEKKTLDNNSQLLNSISLDIEFKHQLIEEKIDILCSKIDKLIELDYSEDPEAIKTNSKKGSILLKILLSLGLIATGGYLLLYFY